MTDEVAVAPLVPEGGALAALKRRLRERDLPVVSFVVLLLVIVAAFGGATIAPHDPNGLDLGNAFRPPFWAQKGTFTFVLGTDNLGRDILSRIIAGARVSLMVAAYAIVFSGGLGGLLGIISGYFGGVVDAVIMRLVDIQLSIPPLALALVMAAVLGADFNTVIIIIVVTYWTWYARIVRSEVLSLRSRDYVALAKVAGCGTATIFARHLLPNVMNMLLVLATLQIGQVIIFEASLSFLGLGIQAPDVSWGLMLADARNYLTTAWWAITMPGVAIMLACLSSNMVGDWLRDTFDPKRRQL